jgi:hypothetical protein
MGAAMNPPSMSEAKPSASRRKGRLQLLLILLGVIGPMILATGMYKLNFWVPEGRSYHGELIGNGSLATAGDGAQRLRGGLPAIGVPGATNPDRSGS